MKVRFGVSVISGTAFPHRQGLDKFAELVRIIDGSGVELIGTNDTSFIGGDAPSIADIRLAATLEFLRGIDYEFPAWAEEYMSAVEAALGEAYSEPAADVREFVASAKS